MWTRDLNASSKALTPLVVKNRMPVKCSSTLENTETKFLSFDSSVCSTCEENVCFVKQLHKIPQLG